MHVQHTSTRNSLVKLALMPATLYLPSVFSAISDLFQGLASKELEKEHFSRLARPLQHQRTLFNLGDANSQ